MTTTPANTADPTFQFKQTQKEAWKRFAPLEAITTSTAARLLRFAGIQPGMRLLDAGCGTGVVAITAARLGATVKGAELLVGRTMMLASRYMPTPPPGVSSPMLWGNPGFIQRNWVTGSTRLSSTGRICWSPGSAHSISGPT
jgi:hypothetical protein